MGLIKKCSATGFVLNMQLENHTQQMVDDMNQDRNAVHYVKFTSSGMEIVVLVVAVNSEKNHELLRLETN